MSRGLGAVEGLQELPDPVLWLAAVLTQLGDVWFVVSVAAAVYWFGGVPRLAALDRRRGVHLLALALGAVALTLGLKEWLLWPRPPDATVARGAESLPPELFELYDAVATAEGYGFPSGHALNATVLWGGLASLLPVGRRRRRYGAAVAVVVLVALTRLALGVHYLVDVVVGAAVGLAFLAAVTRLADGGDRPGRTLAVALVVAAAAVSVAGPRADPLAGLGAVAGAAVAWAALGGRVEAASPSAPAIAVGAAALLPVLGATAYASEAGLVGPSVGFLLHVVAFAAAVALPVVAGVGGRWRPSRSTG